MKQEIDTETTIMPTQLELANVEIDRENGLAVCKTCNTFMPCAVELILKHAQGGRVGHNIKGLRKNDLAAEILSACSNPKTRIQEVSNISPRLPVIKLLTPIMGLRCPHEECGQCFLKRDTYMGHACQRMTDKLGMYQD